MVINILGWYSLVVSIIALLVIIGDNKQKGATRLMTVLFQIPILFYVVLTLFE